MLILGIDTSCDETSISLLKIKRSEVKVLSNIISSQTKLHAQYGGVYPFLAKREHQKNLPIVFKKVIEGIEISKIDLIGITVGPGLEPCLWQGINFAKNLAKKLNKTLVPVNHIESHILANFLDKFQILNLKPQIFPAVSLVVSGGHTQLILVEAIGKYKLIGETRDDAAGECFDKVARLLGLGYPGGPAIAKLAAQQSPIGDYKIKLPRPMLYQKNYDFSFAGLKTAVLYDFKNQPKRIRESKEYIRAMATEVQRAIIDVLVYKTLKAAKDFGTKTIILGGGVVANEELRREFERKIQEEIPNTLYLIPDLKFCTDNGAMVAMVTFFQRHKKIEPEKIRANANLKI